MNQKKQRLLDTVAYSASSRIKRSFWAIQQLFAFSFSRNLQKEKSYMFLSSTSNINQLDNIIEAAKKETEDTKRFVARLKLSEGKTFYAYFGTSFQEYFYSDDFIFVEFPDSKEGMKLLFEYIQKQKIFAINTFDSLGLSIVFYCMKLALKVKVAYMPLAMLYYWNNLDTKRVSFKEKIKNFISKNLYSFSLRSADLVITAPVVALENEMLRGKKDVYTSDWIFSMGAIDYSFAIEQDESNQYSFLQDYDNKLFTYSRVEKGKQIDVAIDAFLKVEQNILGKSCFVVIGDGSYLSSLKNRYKENKNIYFVGWLNKSNAIPLIRKMDLFICPDGGYSIIDTALLKVPAVSFNYDVMSVLIVPGVTGYLVDKTSLREFEMVIENYFTLTINEKNKMKQMCYEINAMRFSSKNIEYERKKVTDKIFE